MVNFFFCGACGSTICGTMEGRPSLFLTAGVFDETGWILPGAHLWKGSAQKWLQRFAGTLDVFRKLDLLQQNAVLIQP